MFLFLKCDSDIYRVQFYFFKNEMIMQRRLWWGEFLLKNKEMVNVSNKFLFFVCRNEFLLSIKKNDFIFWIFTKHMIYHNKFLLEKKITKNYDYVMEICEVCFSYIVIFVGVEKFCYNVNLLLWSYRWFFFTINGCYFIC
jgi:hypothetical protein